MSHWSVCENRLNCSALNCRSAPNARLTIGKRACVAADETSGYSAAVF